MADRMLFHRPLASGIRIRSGKKKGNGLETIEGGTLTGLATRNSDGKKVLVTNLHVMAGLSDGEPQEPSGNEEMYQESVSADKKVGSLPAWDPDSPAWVPIVDGGDNVADVAMCELDEGVDAAFALHDDSDHMSGARQVAAGVVEPREDMELTFLGATSGEATVTVEDVDADETIRGVSFAGITVLDFGQHRNAIGDSGAPYLRQVGPNSYRMSCIHFAGTGRIGWAFPASVAERELGITFGDRKRQLLDGIDLASKHLLRSTGPSLKPNSSTGEIDEDWSTVVAGQSVGDAPIVCVVPTTGAIAKGTADTDAKGVTYTPVRLPGGLSAYKYFQPNNDHYASIADTSPTHDLDGSPKTTTAWARVKFIDRDRPAGSQEIMELEVRKIARWGPPLSAPEFEYQAKVNSYGTGFNSARAVFLPDRLIESTSWTTIWKSSSSPADLGPDFPQRAAAVPGLSPFTMLMSRVGAGISSVPGLASRAVGIEKFFAQHNAASELFEGLGGYFDSFDDDVHHIHSNAAFLTAEKTQTERPRYDWWWRPTRTGIPAGRRLYTTAHWPWKEGARSIEALYYLFKHADTVPSATDSDEDGIRHCYEWLERSGFDGWGLERVVLTGAVGDSNDWGGHTRVATDSMGEVSLTASSVPNASDHLISPNGHHSVYSADHLLRFAIVCGWLYPALRRQGDTARADEVKGWLLKAIDVLLSLQLPWNGVFVDDEGNENCQVDVAGGLFPAYRIVDNVPRSCRYESLLEQQTSLREVDLPGAKDRQTLVPSAHSPHYELSIGVILAYALAYHAVDDGHGATPANWPPVADAGNDRVVAPDTSVTLDGSWSTDPDGDELSYNWTRVAGPTVTLSDATAVSPTFTAPSGPAALTFRLTVTDGRGGSDSDTVEIKV